jgi:hypothetical protein
VIHLTPESLAKDLGLGDYGGCALRCARRVTGSSCHRICNGSNGTNRGNARRRIADQQASALSTKGCRADQYRNAEHASRIAI